METKDDKSLTAIKQINLKLVFGSDPDHESRIVDVTNAIPENMLEELYRDQYTKREDGSNEYAYPVDPSAIGLSTRITGAIETFYDAKGKSKRLFLPLVNPFGAFLSLQQGVNRILRGAIVNQKQLDALLESVDELFNNVEKEREQGLEYAYKEKGL